MDLTRKKFARGCWKKAEKQGGQSSRDVSSDSARKDSQSSPSICGERVLNGAGPGGAVWVAPEVSFEQLQHYRGKTIRRAHASF
jgi:hypothetical protein